jgi:hypothetical protein
MTVKMFLSYLLRIALLCIVFAVTFMAGAGIMVGVMPDTPSEPGLVTDTMGLLILAVANTLLITALVLTSRWSGWKLALTLAAAYFGLVTVMMQIESWYFLTGLTFGPEFLPRLFVMGLPPAIIFIPIAVWVLGKGRAPIGSAPDPASAMPVRQWAWKLAAITGVYLILYFSAGYFIAWQNPEVRAFYGQPGTPQPFFGHMASLLRQDPWLFPFQGVRAVLWVLFALPIIRGSKVSVWWTALLVGLLVSVPQNMGHIIANPLMPIASVRLSHLVETASSTFVFGMVIVWLLHRVHHSWRDLFGLKERRQPGAHIPGARPA